MWAALRDIGGTANDNPAVASSRHTSEHNEGVGATRHCDINESGLKFVVEKVVEWDAHNHRYRIEMVDGPSRPPVDRFLVEVDATADDDATIVSMTATFETTGIVQKAMAFMGSKMMNRVFGEVLDGLDHHVRTGELVTSETTFGG